MVLNKIQGLTFENSKAAVIRKNDHYVFFEAGVWQIRDENLRVKLFALNLFH